MPKTEKTFDWKMVPPVIACILVFIGIFFFRDNIGIMSNFVLLALLVGLLPYLLLTYFEFQKIRAIEEQLPIFMLDLSEAVKTGTSLPAAFKIVSMTDYGRLSEEIIKINNQLSWGVTIEDALASFAKRVNRSELVGRLVRILVESYSSGGNIARTMESTAADMMTIKESERERQAIGQQNILIMYVIYYIFIGIIVGMSKTLIPMLQMNVDTTAIGGILSFQDPCTLCAGSSHIYCISCGLFGLVCQMFSFGTGSVCYYYSLFFIMAVVQGIFTGLVAGQIGENSVIAGIKHSLIMTLTGAAALLVLMKVI